jgi:opacity protein-like surface antigen
MKQRIIGMVLLAIFMVPQPAQAAFGGFRIGALFGAQLLQGRHWYDGNDNAQITNDQVFRVSTISSMYGAHAGYLLELGDSQIVLGGEAYIYIPQANPTISLQLLNGPVEGNVQILHSRSIGIVLTAGMMFNPKVLVYANAGIEMAKFQFNYSFQNPIPLLNGKTGTLPSQQTLHHIFKAPVLGVGAAYKMAPHFLVGVELSSPFFKRYFGRTNAPRAYTYKPVERRLILKLTYLF